MPQPTMQTATKTKSGTIVIRLDTLPDHENDRMCKVLCNSISKFYENPANLKNFEAWQAKRNAKEAKHG